MCSSSRCGGCERDRGRYGHEERAGLRAGAGDGPDRRAGARRGAQPGRPRPADRDQHHAAAGGAAAAGPTGPGRARRAPRRTGRPARRRRGARPRRAAAGPRPAGRRPGRAAPHRRGPRRDGRQPGPARVAPGGPVAGPAGRPPAVPRGPLPRLAQRRARGDPRRPLGQDRPLPAARAARRAQRRGGRAAGRGAPAAGRGGLRPGRRGGHRADAPARGEQPGRTGRRAVGRARPRRAVRVSARPPGGRRLLGLLLAHSALTQVVTFVLRPTTAYRAIELDVPTAWLGALTASFAVVPLVLAVPSGQATDRFGERRVMLAGAVLLVLSAVLFASGRGGAAGLVAGSVVLGTGHLLSVVGQQAAVANTAGPGRFDTAFGHYTFAASLGQALGPALITVAGGGGAPPDTRPLFLVGTGVAVVLLACTALLRLPGRVRTGGAAEAGGMGSVLRPPGLVGAVTVSCVVLAAL